MARYNAAVWHAAREYIARRERTSNPPGQFDKSGRFYAAEYLPCCRGIRAPSRAFPYSEMLHARTLIHVSQLFNCDPALVRAAAKTLEFEEVAIPKIRQRLAHKH